VAEDTEESFTFLAFDFDDIPDFQDIPDWSLYVHDPNYRVSTSVLDAVPLEHLTYSQSKEFRELLEEFADIFAEDGNALGRTDLTQHHIPLKDPSPVKQKARPYPPIQERFIQEEVQRLLEIGIIQPSSSPWASPVVVVKKPQPNEFRLCVDYRWLNKQTNKDAYPMPSTRELLEELAGSAYYTGIDLQSGYWQIAMAPEDRPKTAFCVKGGLYEFNVMPFGLTNAPATFQRLMNEIFKDLHDKCVGVYMDDVLVRSPTWAQHLKDLREVFIRFRQANLRLNIAKCKFVQPRLPFLGYIVSKEGIRTDPEKVRAMVEFQQPKDAHALRMFLGTVGYYRSFIRDYSAKTNPLNRLLKKDEPYIWGEEQQQAFELVKSSMTSAPILAYPDFNRPFSLYTDASKQGLGAILGQKEPDGKREHVILYIARSLSPPEKHYGSSELECLGAVWAITKLQKYLWYLPFDLYTDHQALTSLLNQKHTNSKFVRWVLLLQEFEFKVHYRPGPLNRADSLSRSYLAMTVEDDPEPIIHGKPYKRLQDKLLRIPSKDEIPTILTECHDGLTSGHFGIKATRKRVQRLFWWKTLDDDVKAFVQSCDTCQRYNPPRRSQPMQAIPVDGPFDRWGIDIKGPLPITEAENRYVIAAMDYFTKWPVARAIPNIQAVTVVQFIYEDIICQFGCPKIFQTDNGRSFHNKLLAALAEDFGIDYRRTSPYHPEANGLIERFNRTMGTALAKHARTNKLTWDRYLPGILAAYRFSTHSSTNFSPFRLCFGQDPRLPIDLQWDIPVQGTTAPMTLQQRGYQMLSKLEPDRMAARDNIKKAQDRQQRNHDLRITPYTFQIGERVLLERSHLKTRHDAKLDPKWDGPYYVHDVHGNGTYTLRDMQDGTISRPLHGNRLKLYIDHLSQPVIAIDSHPLHSTEEDDLDALDRLAEPSELDQQ